MHYSRYYLPLSICSRRNPDRQVLHSTTVRLGLKVKVDGYSLPPENGLKAYNFLRIVRIAAERITVTKG